MSFPETQWKPLNILVLSGDNFEAIPTILTLKALISQVGGDDQGAGCYFDMVVGTGPANAWISMLLGRLRLKAAACKDIWAALQEDIARYGEKPSDKTVTRKLEFLSGKLGTSLDLMLLRPSLVRDPSIQGASDGRCKYSLVTLSESTSEQMKILRDYPTPSNTQPSKPDANKFTIVDAFIAARDMAPSPAYANALTIKSAIKEVRSIYGLDVHINSIVNITNGGFEYDAKLHGIYAKFYANGKSINKKSDIKNLAFNFTFPFLKPKGREDLEARINSLEDDWPLLITISPPHTFAADSKENHPDGDGHEQGTLSENREQPPNNSKNGFEFPPGEKPSEARRAIENTTIAWLSERSTNDTMVTIRHILSSGRWGETFKSNNIRCRKDYLELYAPKRKVDIKGKQRAEDDIPQAEESHEGFYDSSIE